MPLSPLFLCPFPIGPVLTPGAWDADLLRRMRDILYQGSDQFELVDCLPA